VVGSLVVGWWLLSIVGRVVVVHLPIESGSVVPGRATAGQRQGNARGATPGLGRGQGTNHQPS